MAKERTCIACGKTYTYCPNCGNSSSPMWMAEFDTEECKDIFNAVSAYNMELIDANEVKKVLKKYDVTDFGKYKKSIADKLKEIAGKKEEPVADKKEESAKSPKVDSFFKGDKFKKNDNKDIANTKG